MTTDYSLSERIKEVRFFKGNGITKLFLNKTSGKPIELVVPPTDVDAFVQSVVAGTNVTVDDTDPLNPVVSSSGGGGGSSIGDSHLEVSGSTFGSHTDGETVRITWSQDNVSGSDIRINPADHTEIQILNPGGYTFEFSAGVGAVGSGITNATINIPVGSSPVIGRVPTGLPLDAYPHLVTAPRYFNTPDVVTVDLAVYGTAWTLGTQDLLIVRVF